MTVCTLFCTPLDTNRQAQLYAIGHQWFKRVQIRRGIGLGRMGTEGCVPCNSRTSPKIHALKGSPNQLQTITCTSSLLHARRNKINEMPTMHRSGRPEGARNRASRTMSRRFADLRPPFPSLLVTLREHGDGHAVFIFNDGLDNLSLKKWWAGTAHHLEQSNRAAFRAISLRSSLLLHSPNLTAEGE